MRLELTGECVAINLVVAYAPREPNLNTQQKEEHWQKLGHIVKPIPNRNDCSY